MAPFSWRRWLGQSVGFRKHSPHVQRRSPRVKARPLSLERMEDRVVLSTSSVDPMGVLTVDGDFNETIFINAIGGNVKINNQDPGSGAALASDIVRIIVNTDSGGSNLVDLTNVLPASYTNLADIVVTVGDGGGNIRVNTLFDANIDLNNQPYNVEYVGSAITATLNLDLGILDVFGQADITTVDGGNSTCFVNMNLQNLTILLGAAEDQTVSDDIHPNNGISRIFDNIINTHCDFRNPSLNLTVADGSMLGGTAIEFQGLDPLRRPRTVDIDANDNDDLLIFGGSATNVVADYVNGRVVLDGLVIGIPDSDNCNVLFQTTMVNFTLQPSAGNNRSITDGVAAHDGITRLLNNDDMTFTDVRNPSGTLTVRDINPGGNSTYNFVAVDGLNRPAKIVLDSGITPDLLSFTNPGTYTTVTEDLVNDTVSFVSTTDPFASVVVHLAGTGLSNILINVEMDNFILRPQAGNHRILQDDGTANNNISRALNNSNGTFSDFRNPNVSLTVVNTTSTRGSIYEFQTLDADDPPTAITLDMGAAGGTQRFTTGTYTNVVENLVNETVSLDGLVINIPGTGPTNLLIDVTMTNFTLQPSANNHRILTDDGAANGISRALNASDGTFSDFRNPSGILLVENTSNTSGSIYEFRGLDAAGTPATVNLDLGDGGGEFRFTGTFATVIEDLVANEVTVGTQVVGILGDGPANVFINVTMADFILRPGENNHRILMDDPTPNNRISRAFNNSDGTFSDFKNPTNSLTVINTSAGGNSIYEFHGLDNILKPRSVALNMGAGGGTQKFTGTYVNVVEDLTNDTVFLDGQVVGIPGTGPTNVLLDVIMVNFTLKPQAGNERIIQEDGVPNNGISRALNADNMTFSDFRNPSGSLTVLNATADATGVFDFQDLDAIGQPARITFNTGTAGGTSRFSGTATEVVENLITNTVSINGFVINLAGNAGTSSVFISATTTDLTLIPQGGSRTVLQDDGTANNGISQARVPATGFFTNFRNPTGTLRLLNASTNRNTTLEFNSLDEASPSAEVLLDAGTAGANQRFSGTHTTVIEDLNNDTVTLNGTTVGIPGTGPTNVTIDVVMANFTLRPGANNHRILRDNGIPNDGISRAFNASDGTFSDFRNPTQILSVVNTNGSDNSIYEFNTLDAIGRPTTINLDLADNGGLLKFTGTYANVIENLSVAIPTVTLTPDLVVSLPGSGPANVFIDVNMQTFVIQPGAGNHRILRDNGVAGDRISRAFNASNNTFSDFRNPAVSVTVQDINLTGGSIYEFNSIDTVGRPQRIILDANNLADTLRFTGTANNVVENLSTGRVQIDNVMVEIPNSAMCNVDMFTASVNFTLIVAGVNHTILRDNGVANDAISQAFNNNNNTFTNFLNPTNNFSLKASNGGVIFELRGLDAAGRPRTTTLTGSNFNDTFLLDYSGPRVPTLGLTVIGNPGLDTVNIVIGQRDRGPIRNAPAFSTVTVNAQVIVFPFIDAGGIFLVTSTNPVPFARAVARNKQAAAPAANAVAAARARANSQVALAAAAAAKRRAK